MNETSHHERWLVSYADFLTLLFALFVVLFASKADKQSLRQVSNTISRALGGSESRVSPATTSPADLQSPFDQLSKSLAEDIQKGSVSLSRESRGLVISLREAAFFSSGDDVVLPPAYAAIGKVAAVLKTIPNLVRLEGHTDSVPIRTDRFRSNWELSAARGIAMLKALNERFDVPLTRMAVVGYGETAAVSPNTTEEGRRRNRRVDVVVLNEAAAAREATARLQ